MVGPIISGPDWRYSGKRRGTFASSWVGRPQAGSISSSLPPALHRGFSGFLRPGRQDGNRAAVGICPLPELHRLTYEGRFRSLWVSAGGLTFFINHQRWSPVPTCSPSEEG